MRDDDRRALRASRRAAASGSLPRCRCPRPTARRRGSGSPDRSITRARDRRALLLAARERDAALADHRVVALREVRRRPCPAATRARRARPARACALCPPAPNAMLSAMVALKRNGSCGTKPMAPRRTASGMSRTSMPSTNTVPGGGSCSRGSRFSSVDLPDPVAPTIAVVVPAGSVARDVAQDGAVAIARTSGAGTRSSPRICSRDAICALAAAASVIAGLGVEHLEHPLPRRQCRAAAGSSPSRTRSSASASIIRYALNATSSPTVIRPAITSRPPATARAARRRPSAAPCSGRRRPAADQLPVAPHVLVVGVAEALDLERLLPVGAHDAHAGQRLLRHRADVGELLLDLLEPPVDRGAEVVDRRPTRTAAARATAASAVGSIDSISAMRDDEGQDACWTGT